MATLNVKQLESFDSGSNYNFEEQITDPNMASSVFDGTHTISGTFSEMGTIYPVALFETLPGDVWDIDVNTLLRALPTVIPLYSRQRLYVYGFWNRDGDLCNYFETFAKKGYSGNVIKKICTLEMGKNIHMNFGGSQESLEMWNEDTYNQTWESISSIQSESMGECLGLPLNYTEETNGNVTGLANRSDFNAFVKGEYGSRTNKTEITALPFMMLLRVWRDYFTNKNYHINDRVLLPDDDAEFRLNESGELISAKNNSCKVEFDISSRKRGIFYHKTGNKTEYTEPNTQENINVLHVGLPVHEYPKDRWTSALPFLQRGDAPTLDYKLNVDPLKVGLYYDQTSGGITTTSKVADLNYTGGMDPSTNKTANFIKSQSTSWPPAANTYGAAEVNNTVFRLEISMANLRRLAIEQTELEKMAKCDGSYREFGLTFFGIVSKNATDHKPLYIGGNYQEIKYTEVVQTSQSDLTPMGSYTGHSTEVMSGNLGHLECDDYGYLMILACIMPDVLYSEGLDDHWTRLYQSQFYLPERSKIGMTNLLNKSIYFDYGDSTDAIDYNEGLFAYQNYGDEYRYFPNRIKGKIAEGFNKSFFPYTQSRVFASRVNWGKEFAIADKNNIRMDYLQAPEEPAFTYDMGLKIRMVRRLPYRPIPANLTGLQS